jgi:hypothetical protein
MVAWRNSPVLFIHLVQKTGMTDSPTDHIETVEDLVTEMAKAINPAAFSDGGSKSQIALCRFAARRALAVVAPIMVREAAALAGDNKEIAANIMRLNEIF